MPPKVTMQFICNKCGSLQPRDEKHSTKNWEVYEANQKCVCGGVFEMKISSTKPESGNK